MKIKDLFLLNDYKNSIEESDILSRHKLIFFKISTLFFLVLYISFILMYDKENWKNLELYYLNHYLFLSAFLNYFALNIHKKCKITYVISVVLYLSLLHIITYKSGGIKNSANAYLLCVILYTYILLGKKMGLLSVILIIINFIYFYYISQYTNLVDDSLNKNDPFLIKIDFLITFIISVLIIWNQSQFLQKTHNEIVENIKESTNKVLQSENEKIKLKSLVAENELKALRAQMNPHFTFNVMNSIQYYLSNNENDIAQVYLSKFSKLIRKVLDNSNSNLITLKDEIEALMIYLELEQMRFKDHFKFEFIVDKNIEIQKLYIPSMLIQPFVENAIKHAFVLEKNGGNISITIKKKNDFYIYCSIIDNGIGRKKSLKNKINTLSTNQNKSYGIDITLDRINVFNTIHETNANIEIIDIEEGELTGTKVIITLPIIED